MKSCPLPSPIVGGLCFICLHYYALQWQFIYIVTFCCLWTDTTWPFLSTLTVDPTSSVDQPVTGVIDGKFDYGYLATVKLGSDILRGVLYHKPTEISGAQFAGVSCLQDSSVFDSCSFRNQYLPEEEKGLTQKEGSWSSIAKQEWLQFFFCWATCMAEGIASCQG